MGRVGLKLCNNENFAQLLAHLTSGSRGSVENKSIVFVRKLVKSFS